LAELKKRNTKKKVTSSVKRARQALKTRDRNMAVKSKLRKAVKALKMAKDGGKLPAVYSEIDRAARKGVLHKKKAARIKSRLAKAKNQKVQK
jgi:small subunit ribosomal protein S20